MLTINLDHVPGREITKTLGMVMGHARVQKDGRGRRFVGSNGKKWPWTDDSQHHEMLMQEGRSRLEEAGESLEANCILGVECRISRDADNLPEVIFIGTAAIVDTQLGDSHHRVTPHHEHRHAVEDLGCKTDDQG